MFPQKNDFPIYKTIAHKKRRKKPSTNTRYFESFKCNIFFLATIFMLAPQPQKYDQVSGIKKCRLGCKSKNRKGKEREVEITKLHYLN